MSPAALKVADRRVELPPEAEAPAPPQRTSRIVGTVSVDGRTWHVGALRDAAAKMVSLVATIECDGLVTVPELFDDQRMLELARRKVDAELGYSGAYTADRLYVDMLRLHLSGLNSWLSRKTGHGRRRHAPSPERTWAELDQPEDMLALAFAAGVSHWPICDLLVREFVPWALAASGLGAWGRQLRLLSPIKDAATAAEGISWLSFVVESVSDRRWRLSGTVHHAVRALESAIDLERPTALADCAKLAGLGHVADRWRGLAIAWERGGFTMYDADSVIVLAGARDDARARRRFADLVRSRIAWGDVASGLLAKRRERAQAGGAVADISHWTPAA